MQTYVWLLTLRRCVVAPLRESKKSLPNGAVKQHGEEAKRKFHATAQRRNVKDSIPQAKTNIQWLSVARLRFFNAHTERLGQKAMRVKLLGSRQSLGV